MQSIHFPLKMWLGETTFTEKLLVMYKYKINEISGNRYVSGRGPWRLILLLMFGFLISKSSLFALAPLRKILALIPGGYPAEFTTVSDSIGYLPAMGPVDIRFGEQVQPFDRMLLHAFPIEEEEEIVDTPVLDEVDAVRSAAMERESLVNDYVNQADIDFNSPVARPESPQPTLQEEYQGNVEFVNPDEFLVFFEKDLSNGDGSDDHIGVPFEVPLRNKPISSEVKSSATYERD